MLKDKKIVLVVYFLYICAYITVGVYLGSVMSFLIITLAVIALLKKKKPDIFYCRKGCGHFTKTANGRRRHERKCRAVLRGYTRLERELNIEYMRKAR